MNDPIPTPENLFLYLEDVQGPIDHTEQSAEALLEHEVQKQLTISSKCDKVLDKISQALDSWTPTDNILEIEIHKGQLLSCHNLVTERLNDKGWEIEEPYQNLGFGNDFLLLRVYPNFKSRDILRSLGYDINERDFPNNSWFAKFIRKCKNPEAIDRFAFDAYWKRATEEYEASKRLS